MLQCSLLMIIEDHALPAAVDYGAALADEYRQSRVPSLPVARQELYAFGAAGRIQAKMRPPSRLGGADPAETELGSVHAVWVAGRWLTPASCPAAPPEDNGASTWQWAHYGAVMNASPTAWLVLWDLELAQEVAA